MTAWTVGYDERSEKFVASEWDTRRLWGFLNTYPVKREKFDTLEEAHDYVRKMQQGEGESDEKRV